MAQTGMRLVLLLVIPQFAFAWGESRHSIDEVLIEHILVDSTHVYCGCKTSWGTNTFGLFVFDRRTERWANYSAGNGFPSNTIEGIRIEGRHVIVDVGGWNTHFERATGHLVSQERGAFKPWSLADTLRWGGLTYIAVAESLIVDDGRVREVHVPSRPPTRTARQSAEQLHGPTSISFHHPVSHAGKVFFVYDRCYEYGCGALGIGIFDPSAGSFAFYPSDSLRGNVTDCFVKGDAIILATAARPYEANAQPANGFIQFRPEDGTFEPWTELTLPPVPLAILSVGQDDREYWIGTDLGVLRVEKSSGEYRGYGICRGVVGRDGVNVHASPGSLEGASAFPVITELAKGDTVRLWGVYDQWCEIDAPPRITGWVKVADCVSEDAVSAGLWSRPAKVVLRRGARVQVAVRVDTEPDANALAIFSERYPAPAGPFEVIGSRRVRDCDWYGILLTTAWVYRDLLVFLME